MPYRTRVFCTSGDIPTLRRVFDFARTKDISLSADETHGSTDCDTADWSQAEITYKPGKMPLVVECNLDDGTEDCLMRQELNEFMEMVRQKRFAFSRKRVLKHLEQTRFIVVSQLLGDIDDDGYQANDAFLGYFVENCGGMVHADLEGFYDKGTLILKTD